MRLELASKQPRNLPRNLDRVTQTGANLVADLTWTETRCCLEANVHKKVGLSACCYRYP
jgi:hypothetical protein